MHMSGAKFDKDINVLIKKGGVTVDNYPPFEICQVNKDENISYVILYP